ncbi:MAG: Rrf2 family transcriptional regulator [bacterium]
MQTYITREQDYALRILSALAGHNEQPQLNITMLCKKLHITRSFAGKIIHKLKHAGIVSTTQGQFGGVTLSKSAGMLSIYDVLSTIGFRTKFNECLRDEINCPLETICGFHSYFHKIEKNFLNDMKSKMISEFIIHI